MAKLVLIFGPQAVGKMTVGQELAKVTDLKLFHNHMTIELVSNFFSYGTPEGKKLVHLFRFEIFKEVAKSDLEGLIFTYVWSFEHKEDWEYVEKIKKIFEENGGEVYFVELQATLEERLKRNVTSNRLKNKPTKRDTEKSQKRLLEGEEKYRCNSNPGEIKEKNYIKIDNTNISPEDVALIIKERFKL